MQTSEYKNFVVQIIRAYKNDYFKDVDRFSIALHHLGRYVGRLRPVPVVMTGESAGDISLQTKWRNLHKGSFLVDPFVATDARTLAWMKETYINNDDRIIFMILDVENTPIGHLSFENFIFSEKKCEYGRLIRGAISKFELESKYNLIEIAQIAFLRWGFDYLDLSSVYGTQFKNNTPVNILHSKCGFTTLREYEHQKETGAIMIAEVMLKRDDFILLHGRKTY